MAVIRTQVWGSSSSLSIAATRSGEPTAFVVHLQFQRNACVKILQEVQRLPLCVIISVDLPTRAP
jgi:hypothetical protein